MPARQPDSFCHPPLLWAPAWAKPWQPDQHHFNNFTHFTALPSQNPLSPTLPDCQPFSWAKPRPCLGQALAFPNQPFHYPTRPPSSLRQVSRACWPGPSPCHFLPWAKPCPSLSQALGTPDLIFGLPFSKTFPTLAPDVLQIASTSSRSVRASALAHWPCSHTIPYELRWPQNSGFSPTPGQRCAFWVRLFHPPDNHHSEIGPTTTEAMAITNTRTATTTTHKTVPVPLPPPIPSPTPPPTLWLGPWPAVGRKPLNPARGPRGPYWPCLCRTASPSPKEKGACTPCRRPSEAPRFTVFFAFPIFSILWLKMGQHGPT